jgi:hypothetical protein
MDCIDYVGTLLWIDPRGICTLEMYPYKTYAVITASSWVSGMWNCIVRCSDINPTQWPTLLCISHVEWCWRSISWCQGTRLITDSSPSDTSMSLVIVYRNYRRQVVTLARGLKINSHSWTDSIAIINFVRAFYVSMAFKCVTSDSQVWCCGFGVSAPFVAISIYYIHSFVGFRHSLIQCSTLASFTQV